MKFKEFFSEKSIITELSQKTLDKLPKNLSDLLTNKKLPFEKIFNGKLRLLEYFKSKSEYGEQIKNLLGNDFQIDFEKWVGHKLTDSEKKNPIRIGKLLQKKKQELEKNIKQIDDYNKNGAKSGSLPTVALFMNYEAMVEKLKNIDMLLKISDLQKAHVSTSKSQYAIIYSRVPVDVARMSDFSWRSCHSEGGDYFSCALADSMLNAGIAYLVDSQQLIDAAGGKEKIDDFLQKEEIFSDSGRDVQGIEPLARIRIRNVIDENGNQIAVPSLKIYKNNKISGIESDFVDNVKQWAKRQDASGFEWNDTLTLKGGSYQDLMYDVKSMVNQIWGIDIQYNAAGDEAEIDDSSQEQDHLEEQFWDNVRENINLESLYRDILGNDYDDLFDVNLDLYNGNLVIEYNVSDEFISYLKKHGSIENKNISSSYKVNNFDYSYDIVYRLNNRREVRFEIQDLFTIYNFDYDVESSYFDYSGYKRYVENHITKIIETFIKEFIPDSNIELRYYLNKAIANFYDVSYQEVSDEEIEYLLSWEKKEEFYSGILPNFPYKFEPTNYSYNFKVTKEVEEYIKNSSYIFGEYVLQVIDKKFDNIMDKLYIDLFECLVKVPQPQTKIPTDGFLVRLGDNSFSLKDSIRIVVDSRIKKSLIEFKLGISETDLQEIVDNNLVKEYHDLMKFLYDDLFEEIKEIKYFSDLQDLLEKRIDKNKLKDQGQMEFDLSSINRIMNNFDSYIYKLWTEDLANMGKGGLSNRVSSSTNQQNTPSSKSGFGMSSPSPKPANNSNNSNKGVNITVPENDLDNVLLNQNTNFNQLLQDPENHKPLFSYITNSLMNPQYKNRQQLQNLLQNNKDLSGAYSNFINKGETV